MATDYVVRFTGQDNLSGTINQVRQRLEDVGSSTTRLDQIQQKFQKIEQSTAPLKRKLRDLKNLMAQMNLDGLSGTDLFNRMAQQAGTYADALGDATTATNVFANDNFKLEAMAQGLTGIAGAASIATGVMGVLGTENEKVAQAIMKVQSVLAILNGVQAVANVLNKDSALMLRLKQIRTAASTAATRGETAALGANTVAQAVNGATTKKGTLIQNAWNIAKAVSKALLGDFTGLVLVGAGALLTYALATDNSADKLDEQAKATDKAKEAMTKYKDDVASSTGSLVGKYKLLQNEWNNLKTVGEKTQWIKDNATEFKNLGVKVTDLKSAEDVFVNNTSNVITALKARASAMAAQTMLTDAYTEYYKTIMQADGSVAGGGFYNKYNGGTIGTSNASKIPDEWQKAGLKENEDYTYKWGGGQSGYGFLTPTQKGIDKVNDYRMQQARATNQRIHTEAEQQLNKTVDFATTKINEANAVIQANGLDFSPSGGDSGGGNRNKPNTTLTYDAGSLAAEEAELSRLQAILKNTRFESDAVREDALQAVRDQAAKVEQMKLQLKWQVEPELDLSDDTITGLTNQIQAIEKRLKDEVLTPAERQQLVTDREVKIRLRENLEVQSGLKEHKTEQPKTKSELYNELKGMAGDVQSDFDNGLIDKDEAIKRIADINAQIALLGGKPIKLEFQSNFDQVMEDFNAGINAINGIDGIVKSVQSLSQSLKEGADAWEIFMGAVGIASSVISAISAVMETYNILSSIHTAKKTAEGAATTAATTAVTAAESAKAAADTASIAPAMGATAAAKAQEAAYLDLAAAAYFAAHASIPFAGFGIAAGFVSSMMAMMAAQTAASAAIAAFADGGIVSGNTFHGDKILARVNAGEMILNQNQQANLFRALNSGNQSGTIIPEIKIKGSDLHIAFKNYNNKMSKIK